MTDNTAVTFEVSPEVTIKNRADFVLYASLLGVQVGERGRLPSAALLAAIDADDRFTLVDTEYFNRASAGTTSKGGNGYGDRLAALRAIREQAIKDAHTAYDVARTALRAELGMPADDAPKAVKATGNGYVVSARIPQRDKETGLPKRNKAGDKVLFLPKATSVTVTNAEIRELVPNAGERGRLSQSQTLYAAVVKGEWLPRELLATDGWETVLLADTKVEPVTDDVAVAS